MTGQASFAPVAIAKDDIFCLPQHVESYARDTLRATRPRRLAARSAARRIHRSSAHHLANVNALHPFRDGNGRAQRAFFSQLAAEASFDLRWQLISPEANNAAAVAAMQGDERPLRGLLGEITSERSDPPTGSN